MTQKLIRTQWTAEIGRLFVPALDGAALDDFKFDCESGRCDLWECNGCYVITEDRHPRLHVWLVAGRNFKDAAHAINNHLHAFDFTDCSFRTRRPASLRQYGFLKPTLINPKFHEYRVCPF